MYPRVFLMDLLTMAYSLPSDQIQAPEWVLTEQYSIAAKMPSSTTRDQFNLMLQNLLKERFRLASHWGTKAFPAYSLSIVPGGHKMRVVPPKEQIASNAPANPDRLNAPPDPKGFPVLPPGATHVVSYGNGMVRSANRVTMAQFAKLLGPMLQESNGSGDAMDACPRVVDKTGLAGEYEFTLEFAGSPAMPASVVAQLAAGGTDTTVLRPASAGPSLFSALEGQLGLKLVKGNKVNLDLLIIDHLDRVPIPN